MMKKKIGHKFNIIKAIICLIVTFVLIFNINCNLNSDENKRHVNDVYQKIIENINDDNLTEDIFIPDLYNHVNISFESSDETVISNDGVVTRYLEDKLVVLTIYLEYAGETYTKKLDIIVPAITSVNTGVTKQDLEEVLSRLNIDNSYQMLENSIELPIEAEGYQITWSIESEYKTFVSLNENILTANKVTTDTLYSFTATISYENIIVSRTFSGVVKRTSDELSDAQKLANIKNDLKDILDLENEYITGDINLKTSSLYESVIVWSSSDENVISTEGIVNKNLSKTTKVTIGYQIILGNTEYDYEFFAVYIVGTGSYSAYYKNAESKTGSTLFNALRTIIASTHKKTTSYSDCYKYVYETDGDPNISGNIILFYSKKSISGKWDSGKSWNREHVWPQSKGWFGTSGAGADLHHIRPSLPSINSARGNTPYGEISGYYEPADNVKGDAARIIFYLKTRYSESDSYSFTKVAQSLTLLLEWNALDPVDDYEMRRNEAVYDIQGNRNPFIDYPEFAELIWGTQASLMVDESVVAESIYLLTSKCNSYIFI